MLTQKHYESNLIRPKIENQSQRYPIDPNMLMVVLRRMLMIMVMVVLRMRP
jgi:hypothetical protein